MNSRRLWTIIGTVSIVGFAIILLLMPDPNTPMKQASKPSPKPLRPKQEKTVKLAAMDGDLDATDRLSRMDAKQHLQALLRNPKLRDPESMRTYVRKHQDSHKHFEQVIWFDLASGRKTVMRTDGHNWSREDQNRAAAYIQKAETMLKRGQSYASPKFTAGGHPCFLMAEPSADGKRGAAAVVSQKVLSLVSDHQKKNLRLIPYPKEGKFRVESVHSDTLREMTVKTGHDNEKASHFYENEIVVRFQREPSPQELSAISRDIAAETTRKLGYAYIFRSNRMDYRELREYFIRKWSPLYAEPHYMYLTNETAMQPPGKGKNGENVEKANIPNDLLFSKYQWNLPAIETNRGWNLSKGSNNVIIAVVDTGVDLQHTDLKGQLVQGYNVIDPDKEPLDDVGHGTHVAGIIGALVNNGEGVAGMSWYNKIMPVKALDSSGSGTTYAVAEGIIWATDHGAKVINLSLGNYADSRFLHDAVKYAYDRDVLLVAASGNDNTERPGYPAAYPEVMAVGATNPDMTRAEYSNFGDYIDVAAPGTNIASTYPGNQYAALSGTSMASPHVAAMAGLIRSLNPNLTNNEVKDIMIRQAVDLGQKGKDKYYGSGRIDVLKSLQAAGGSEAPLQMWPHRVLERLQEELRRLNVHSSK